ILEGIAFRATEVIAAMNEFTTIKNKISIDGGLSANPYFCQFLADVMHRQVIVQSSAELTAFGTAQLAAANTIELSLTNSSIRSYMPETDKRPYLEKFKDATDRAAKWRS
ncbi:MAG: FGGY-family carbohydrate kinase, partial [Desulfuromusa sp.]|nr:FGGY-family carbohydrate kinase [Desulfuromusa sp.]